MRFSIIIMTYQKFDNLAKNLHSIHLQDFNDYEIILSDDGSGNYDEEYIKMCIEKEGLTDQTILHHFKTNVGTVKNYNFAIRLAKGEIIVPLSQDDQFMDASVLGDLDNFFRKHDAQACFCKRSFGEDEILPIPMEFNFLKETDLNCIHQKLLFRNFIYGATLYFKKETWGRLGGFDERFRLLEDHPFALKLLSNGVRIYPFERISILYGREGISSRQVVHSEAGLELIKDNVRLYDEIISKEVSGWDSRYVKRAFQYRWKVSFECHLDPKKTKIRKLFTYIKFIDVAIIHKVYHIKYGKEADAIFVDRILPP